MPSLSRKVAHDYDPKASYHNHAVNLPHLTTWIDELIALTERALPVRNNPTTEQLVEALQRYDAVFRELVRQTSKFSVATSKMYGKVWGGTLNLLDYMIKSYHRYVSNTNHVQEQAQSLLKQRQALDAAASIQKEEFELERTALRAQVRTLQADKDAKAATCRNLERENMRLRSVIDEYIMSEDLSRAKWDVLDSDVQLARAKAERRGTDAEEDEEFDEEEVHRLHKARRAAQVDAVRKHLRTLNRLDIEMNEAIANVLKEEDRQRMLVSDLTLLIAKNKDRMELYAEQLGQRIIKAPPVVKTDVSIQVDERPNFGVVSDLTSDRNVDTMWDDDVKDAPPEVTYKPFTAQYTMIPFMIRRFMVTFPKVLRVPPIAWVLQTIFAIYFDKNRVDADLLNQGKAIKSMGLHVYDFFLRNYGMKSLADNQMAQFVYALNYHHMSHRRVACFSHQMGVTSPDEMPDLDIRDTSFLLRALDLLLKKGELQPEEAPKGVSRSLVFRNAVRRQAVVQIVPELVGEWLEDGGMEVVKSFKAMPHCKDMGLRYLDIDEVLDVLIDVWSGIRITWEDHLHHLFTHYSSSFTVLSDVQFASDLGASERDSVLVQVNRSHAMDCSRRPMRNVQRRETVTSIGTSKDNNEDATHQNSMKHYRPMQVGNPSKEAVCDCLTRDDFFSILQRLSPYLPEKKVEQMYESAVEWGFEAISAIFEQTWIRLETEEGKPFYLNNKTGKTQWTKPYNPRTFRAQEIEEEAFMAIIIQYDVFPVSPFLELLHLAPKDLWPNSDMFLKQIEARKRKEREKIEAQERAAAAKIRAAEEAVAAEKRKIEEAEEEARQAKLAADKEAAALAAKSKKKRRGKKGQSVSKTRTSHRPGSPAEVTPATNFEAPETADTTRPGSPTVEDNISMTGSLSGFLGGLELASTSSGPAAEEDAASSPMNSRPASRGSRPTTRGTDGGTDGGRSDTDEEGGGEGGGEGKGGEGGEEEEEEEEGGQVKEDDDHKGSPGLGLFGAAFGDAMDNFSDEVAREEMQKKQDALRKDAQQERIRALKSKE